MQSDHTVQVDLNEYFSHVILALRWIGATRDWSDGRRSFDEVTLSALAARRQTNDGDRSVRPGLVGGPMSCYVTRQAGDSFSP